MTPATEVPPSIAEPAAASPVPTASVDAEPGDTALPPLSSTLGPYDPPVEDDWLRSARYHEQRMTARLADPSLDPETNSELLAMQASHRSAFSLANGGSLLVLVGALSVVGGVVFTTLYVADAGDDLEAQVSLWRASWAFYATGVAFLGPGIPLFVIGKSRIRKIGRKLREMETTRVSLVPMVNPVARNYGMGLQFTL